MTDWQPIETAPDDGRKIIVYGGSRTEPTIEEADGGWWRLYIGAMNSIPTHWMPLPEPPKSKE